MKISNLLKNFTIELNLKNLKNNDFLNISLIDVIFFSKSKVNTKIYTHNFVPYIFILVLFLSCLFLILLCVNSRNLILNVFNYNGCIAFYLISFKDK